MTDARDPEGEEGSRTYKSYLRDLGAALIFGLLSFGLSMALNRRSSEVPVTGEDQDQTDQSRRDLHSYILGVSLGLVLTVVPFGLVYWSILPRFGLSVAIGVAALIQIVVHFRFFLHINPPKRKVDDLQLVLFSTFILFLMAGGTIWIMANLATRMH